VKQTERSLRVAGRNGDELFVLWSGHQDGDVFAIRSGHVPHQTAYKTPDGLCVMIEGEALHELNSWLFNAKETLAVQIHCHPDDAYHSETDDRYPIVTALGGASIVIPEFCRNGLFDANTALYRLSEKGWSRTDALIHDLISVL
jgi:hypothetical protein